MKAIVAEEFGPPETLCLMYWDSPTPGPDEVLIRVHSVGVAFVDSLMAEGKHQFKPALPFIPGNEFSGEVIGTGAQVTGFAPGDRVCGGKIGGVYAQEIVVPAQRVQKLPDGVDMDEAAVLRGNFLTAWHSLVDWAHIREGECVLVLGAAGGVGIAACQIAKLHGARVIASASSDAKRALALANGADDAIDSGADDWRDQVKALAGKPGVDVVVDPVGGNLTEKAFRSLGYRGRHLMIGFASGNIPSLPTNLPLVKGASLIGISATKFDEHEPDAIFQERAHLLDLFAQGKIRPAIGAIHPKEDHVEAMRSVYSGEAVGRVVLRME